MFNEKFYSFKKIVNVNENNWGQRKLFSANIHEKCSSFSIKSAIIITAVWFGQVYDVWRVLSSKSIDLLKLVSKFIDTSSDEYDTKPHLTASPHFTFAKLDAVSTVKILLKLNKNHFFISSSLINHKFVSLRRGIHVLWFQASQNNHKIFRTVSHSRKKYHSRSSHTKKWQQINSSQA